MGHPLSLSSLDSRAQTPPQPLNIAARYRHCKVPSFLFELFNYRSPVLVRLVLPRNHLILYLGQLFLERQHLPFRLVIT